jgi:hypothetical protein
VHWLYPWYKLSSEIRLEFFYFSKKKEIMNPEILFFIVENFEYSSFLNSEDGQVLLNKFFGKNKGQNGFHLVKIFLKDRKLISYADYLHYSFLEKRYNLNLKLGILNHMAFIMPTEYDGTLVSFFSSKPTFYAEGLNTINNVLLTDNTFLYTNKTIICSDFTSLMYFEIINDANRFPKKVLGDLGDLERVVLDAYDGFLQGYYETRKDPIRFNISTGGFERLQGRGIVDIERINDYINNYDITREKGRIIRTIIKETRHV